MKIANPKKYLNYLTDIYNGEQANRRLREKHGVASYTSISCRELQFTDINNFSNMANEPKMIDAKKLIDLNSKYAKNINRQYQLKLKGQPVKPRKKKQAVPIAEKPSKGREISILWGMIKIKS